MRLAKVRLARLDGKRTPASDYKLLTRA
jgi:hypothetical protein